MISNLNTKVYKLILVIATILLTSRGYAQGQNPIFVPVASGELSGTFVRCIFKDEKGFMWFGTSNGLIRYDGTNVFRYENNPSDSKTIPNNRINAIIEDKNKNLWIGTGEGLAVYNREKDNFLNIDSIKGNSNFLNHKYISTLNIDRFGKIWIGTHGNGLNIYDPNTFTFTYISDSSQQAGVPRSNYVVSLFLVGDTMWAGTKGGLKLFDTEKMRSLALPVSDKSITSKEITQVIRDSKGNIWLSTVDSQIIKMTATKGGYQVTKTELKRNMNGELGGGILTLMPDGADNLWIGGEKCGLNYLDAKTHKIIYFEAEEGNNKTIPTNSIRSVYVDNTGITWIGTYNKGVYLVDNNAKKFEIIQRDLFTKRGLTGNNVRGIAEDKAGNIWVAFDGGGLGKLNPINHEIKYEEKINNSLGTRYLTALRCDAQGDLWIGTWGRGVFKLNHKTHELKNYKLESSGFGDNVVFSLFEDKQQRMWVGSLGSGLFYMDKENEVFVPLRSERKENQLSNTAYVASVFQDSDGVYWAGTLFGLYKLKIEQGNLLASTKYSKIDSPSTIGSHEIYTIYEDEKRNIWFGTGDNGLAALNKKSAIFKNIKKQDGLLGNKIGGILSDSKGNIWISSNMGLTKYNPTTNSFRNYTKQDGLPSNEFNSNAALRASNGKFYFGSNNGLVTFYPDSVRDCKVKPVVYLSDLKINNRSVQIDAEGSPLKKHISLTNKLELSYNQRSFVLDFVAVNYGQSATNQYCYKLDGFDVEWNCVGTKHTATYTNLDPGHYVFLVKAFNSDGVPSESPAKIEITINPAPWNTWWAMLLYVLLFTFLIFLFLKVRIDRLKIKNQLEFERLAREKEHELIESKTQFFTNISHEFRTPLSLISMPLENLISDIDLPGAAKERLGMMRNSVDKMMGLVNELMDFSKMESSKLKLRVQYGEMVQFINEVATVFNDLAAKKNIHFGIHSMIRSLDGWFDQDKLEKILANILSNAFKYTSENGKINLIIRATDQVIGDKQISSRCLEVVIIDSGIGISPEELPFIFDKFYQTKAAVKIAQPGTGIGLSLTKGLVELHHGSIKAESSPDHETKFTILIPIDRSIYSDDDICENSGYITTNDDIESKAHDFSRNDLESPDNHDKHQILIVEDNDELRNYIAQELRSEFSVLEAKNGQEGLEVAFERTPDLIISDILMPVKTGIELCNEIKSNIKTSHIPLILLTAKTTTDDQVTGLSVGADVYITKPFSMRFLTAQVNQIINSRQKLYSRFSQDVYLLPGKVTGNGIDKEFLQKAIDYIISNLQNPQLGVDSIADLFNLSKMQVYRKIKALTGNSVVDFIRMVRIKQALKLMEAEKLTISEIAYQTGFSSASYFTRCFKDEYGKAPSEYLENRV